jgi:hypothetical protein
MKLVVTGFLMLIYLNVSLVPNLREVDSYVYGSTKVSDDINSFYEYVNILLGIDSISDDEDSDTGTEDDATFNHKSFLDYHPTYTLVPNLQESCSTIRKNIYFFQNRFSSNFTSIETPPPKV